MGSMAPLPYTLVDVFTQQPFEGNALAVFPNADGVDGVFRCRASVRKDGTELKLNGEGNGPIAAFVHALQSGGAPKFEVTNYREHALSAGEGASAISYIQIKLADGKVRWGAAVDTNIELASIKAVLSALNRA